VLQAQLQEARARAAEEVAAKAAELATLTAQVREARAGSAEVTALRAQLEKVRRTPRPARDPPCAWRRVGFQF
jgi:hypothetical protein